jgi:hypothetical protein
MDRERFDALAKRVSTRQTRRTALATVLGALLLPQEEPLLASAKRKRHRRRRSHRPGKQKDNRKGKRNDPGKVGTQNCPDAYVNCLLADNIFGLCTKYIGSLGPIGHCYDEGCCGPCGHIHDMDYWASQCDQTFPACLAGGERCYAVDGLFLGCFAGCAPGPLPPDRAAPKS